MCLVLIYHYVCPDKYRRVVFDKQVDETLKLVCQEIEKCYDIKFLEIETDRSHVHFLVQSVPKLSPTQIIRTIKSIRQKKCSGNARRLKRSSGEGDF